MDSAAKESELSSKLHVATYAILNEKAPADVLAPSLAENGAYLIVFASEAELESKKASKCVFMGIAALDKMLGSMGISFPTLTYDKKSDVIVISLVFGVAGVEDAVYHTGMVYNVGGETNEGDAAPKRKRE